MIPRWWKHVPERWRPVLLKHGFNRFPAWRATGGRVTEVSRDLRRIVVALPLHRGTRNAVGTLFGGALFAATDGLHPALLALHLGRDYVIWDKAGAVRYRKPGRATLYAEYHIDDTELSAVRQAVAVEGECERTYRVELRDADGVVHTEVERTVYVASWRHYEQKRRDRAIGD
jgi:acyl-coenzyme A thioesterase PaaI-like protein